MKQVCYLKQYSSISKVTNKPLNFYHISKKKLVDEVLMPRIPDTAMENEDAVTPRVCFSTCLSGCYKGLGQPLSGAKRFYVYVPENYTGSIIAPSKSRVPDVLISREKWFMDPVKVKCIGYVKFSEYKKRRYLSAFNWKYGYPYPVKYHWLKKI